MSLVPIIYSDWWEDLGRHLVDTNPSDLPTPLWLDEGFFEDPSFSWYRPRRRSRRYHPFLRNVRSRGTSVRSGRSGSVAARGNEDKFLVTLDVQQFAPEEITVKVVDRNVVVVEAKHHEKEDEHGWISRQFVRKYQLPEQYDLDGLTSALSSDGVLTITAPRKEPRNETNERLVRIEYTGQPAIADYSSTLRPTAHENNIPNSDRPKEENNPSPHRQVPRGGRKGNVKAA